MYFNVEIHFLHEKLRRTRKKVRKERTNKKEET